MKQPWIHFPVGLVGPKHSSALDRIEFHIEGREGGRASFLAAREVQEYSHHTLATSRRVFGIVRVSLAEVVKMGFVSGKE